MSTRGIWTTGLFVVAILFLGVTAHADLYMKQTKHTDAFTVMGQTQPEKNETVVYWFGKDRVRMDTGDSQSMIVMLEKKVMYVLDHDNKSYSEAPVGMQEALDEAVKAEGDEEAEKAAEMYKEMAQSLMKGLEAKVTDTGETKKIKDWDCRKYLVELSMPMGKSQGEIWATESIKIDPKVYWTATNAMMAAQPGFEKIIEEMQKIKGVVVLNIVTVDAMGAKVKSTEELVEIMEKSAPADAYELPKDYKRTQGMMME